MRNDNHSRKSRSGENRARKSRSDENRARKSRSDENRARKSRSGGNHSRKPLRVDNRARIPLALVGVLLLVTSVTVIGYVETRQTANPAVDASTAIDQTEAVTQTAVRDGTQRATELAAEQPLTSPADNRWGDVLRNANATESWTVPHPTGYSDSLSIPNDYFKNYLKALIYLEVQNNLAEAGQNVDGVETTVSLPPITDNDTFAKALERITLSQPESGTLQVKLSNVTLSATHEGEQIQQRETTMNVSIATPIIQLHKRVETFQRALNADITEPGFAQRFNARIYALGWARGWAQNYRAPIVEVIANRHIQPSANSALYRTQQDIFGTADPTLDNAVRLGWTCMAIKDGKAMFDEYMTQASYENLTFEPAAGSLHYGNYTGNVPMMDSAQQLCDSAQLLFGDRITGKHPEPPGVQDLLGNAPGMEANETIAVEESAAVPLSRMATNPDHRNSFASAIERLFTITGKVNSTVDIYDPLTLETACKANDDTSDLSRTQKHRTIQLPNNETLEAAGRYHRFTARVGITVKETRTCKDGSYEKTDQDTVRMDVTTTVSELEASPNATIEKINTNLKTEYVYERGPADAANKQTVPQPDFRNYAGAGEHITEKLLGGTTAHAYDIWLDKQLHGLTDPENVSAELSTTGTVTLDHKQFLNHSLETQLTADIIEIQQTVANISQAFPRTEILSGGSESPYANLISKVETQTRNKYLERHEPYKNIGQKAVYEARHAYVRLLLDELETLNKTHQSGVSGINDTLADVDSSLSEATTFLQQGLDGSEPDPVELPSSELTDNVSYEIAASPTYLVGKNVTKQRVPAIQADKEFAPLAMKNRNYLNLPYQTVVDGIFQKLASFIGIGEPDAKLSFRMAGDVLMAGELAIEANEGDQKSRLANPDQFEGQIEGFRDNVNDSIEKFYEELAKETVIELYPTQLAACIVIEDLSDPRLPAADEPDCWSVRDTHPESLTTTIKNTREEIEVAARETLKNEYNSTAQRALKIGDGNATAPLLEAITSAINDSTFRSETFDERYDPAHWPQIVESAVRPAFLRASSMKVEIGSIDTAEQIDQSIQTALKDVSKQVLKERVDQVGSYALNEYENWVGDWKGDKIRPARVPAGLPLLPLPGKWIATVNAWDIQLAGQYARFAVSANVGTPEEVTATTYVREQAAVTREIAGTQRTLGQVEPIEFSSRSQLIVVVSPGVGVGDRNDNNPECSSTYPYVGYLTGNDAVCGAILPFGDDGQETTDDN